MPTDQDSDDQEELFRMTDDHFRSLGEHSRTLEEVELVTKNILHPTATVDNPKGENTLRGVDAWEALEALQSHKLGLLEFEILGTVLLPPDPSLTNSRWFPVLDFGFKKSAIAFYSGVKKKCLNHLFKFHQRLEELEEGYAPGLTNSAGDAFIFLDGTEVTTANEGREVWVKQWEGMNHKQVASLVAFMLEF